MKQVNRIRGEVMVNPQPTDAKGFIVHEIQENILMRDFTVQQLKIIYLIIRLSWGCGSKAWKYENYTDFEVIGIYKTDVAKRLRSLADANVIKWFEDYKLLIFNKYYDEWLIPIKATSNKSKIDSLIHKSLKNANLVSEILTTLVKHEQGLQNTNPKVSETLTKPLVKHLRFETANADVEQNTDTPKERIKERIKYISSSKVTPEKFYQDNFGPIKPFVADSIRHWIDDGVEETLIVRFMEEAVSRGKANWNYVNEAIKRKFDVNIKTLEQYESHEAERKRNKNSTAGKANKKNDFDFDKWAEEFINGGVEDG